MEAHKFLIGGAWRAAGQTAAVINPYTGKAIAEVYQASAKDVEDAIAAAGRALPELTALPAYRRAKILLGVAQRMRENAEEIAMEITAQVAKPIRYSRAEVERAVVTFTLAAEEATRIAGVALPLDTARGGERAIGITRRFPIGIIAAISPFNFPLNLAAHKAAPAFAAGNASIIKPPPQAPLTGLRLGRYFLESGAPAGAVNVLPCANDVAERLAADERIAMLSFTGSARVGWLLKSKAGKKKVLLELGGNAAVVVEDARDLAAAARKIAASAFAYAGQVCISAQRIYVRNDIFQEFCGALLAETATLKSGDPADAETAVGPLIDAAALARIREWIAAACDTGAEILCGGTPHGAMLPPTILANVASDQPLCSEEAFAPVAIIESYDAFEDALARVNDSRYGLQAGVFTHDMAKAMQAFETIRAGAVVINNVPSFRMDSMPYGGMKDSGLGREGVRYAIEEMTEERMMIVNGA